MVVFIVIQEVNAIIWNMILKILKLKKMQLNLLENILKRKRSKCMLAIGSMSRSVYSS